MVDEYLSTRSSTPFWILAALILTAYLSPWLLQGHDAQLRIHDNLDFTRAPLRADPSLLLAPSDQVMPQLMNGLPRRAFGSEFNLETLLASLLPRFEGSLVNQILLRLLALGGMFLLLGLFIPREQDPRGLIRIGVATCFALLPYYPWFGGTIPGMALQAWAFIAILRGPGRPTHWLTLALVPLYSRLLIAPLFLLMAFGFTWLNLAVASRRANLRLLAALLLSSLVYLACEYRLLAYALGESGLASHRVEFGPFAQSIGGALDAAKGYFFDGHKDHGATHARPLVLLTLALSLCLLVWRSIRSQKSIGRQHLLLYPILVAILAALWAGLYRWRPIQEFMQDQLLTLSLIQWDRTYLLLPIAMYLAFAMALVNLGKLAFIGRFLVPAILLAQVGILFLHSDHQQGREEGEASYAEFFAFEQMREIKAFIGTEPDSYRIVSLGMYPSIAAESGMYCLDAYIQDYPLSYKHEFRRVIRGELDKNPALENYYDAWGSRCYLFVDDLDEAGRRFLNRRESVHEISSLDLDLAALYAMGARYILSAARIGPDALAGLSLLKVFEREDSAWSIHLYAIEEPG